jgi:hypothetical protein
MYSVHQNVHNDHNAALTLKQLYLEDPLVSARRLGSLILRYVTQISAARARSSCERYGSFATIFQRLSGWWPLTKYEQNSHRHPRDFPG